MPVFDLLEAQPVTRTSAVIAISVEARRMRRETGLGACIFNILVVRSRSGERRMPGLAPVP
ncbi:MAG: hypothetical protein Tsb0019_29780 [Roseibium sp.]